MLSANILINKLSSPHFKNILKKNIHRKLYQIKQRHKSHTSTVITRKLLEKLKIK